MKGKNVDKMGVILGVIITLTVMATALVWVSAAGFDPGSIIGSGIIIIISVLAAFVIIGKARSVKRGLPAQDELSKKTMYKAGYYAWIATIYLSLAASYFSDEFGIIGRHVGYIILMGSALLFFVFYFWIGRKGDV
jgi:hypothetical protein